MVETPETKEQNQIKGQASTLLSSKDYKGLEDLAGKYRASKECYADGLWKLTYVYIGIEPSDDASESEWATRQSQVNDWIREQNESITARVAKARLLIGYAWKIRGSGWANSVKETEWKKFHERLQQAVHVLEESRALKEKCPVYWSSLQRAALGLQTDKVEFEAVFNQAIKEYPDYWFYYQARTTFLLPRWYGAPGEWEKDLGISADRIGSENGDMLYAQVVWASNLYGGGIDIFEGHRISWGRVDKGFEVILKQFPDSLAAKNERAYLAAQAGEKEKARNYFLLTKGQADLTAWEDKEAFDNFIKWAFTP